MNNTHFDNTNVPENENVTATLDITDAPTGKRGGRGKRGEHTHQHDDQHGHDGQHGHPGRRGFGPGQMRGRVGAGFGPEQFGPEQFGPQQFGPRPFGPQGFGPYAFGPGAGLRRFGGRPQPRKSDIKLMKRVGKIVHELRRSRRNSTKEQRAEAIATLEATAVELKRIFAS
ncbi:MAG: hypothetical protein JWQ43_3845 [Glaciihabitans sp.]|nr:hypothetical protein [Glaciihabitans sp.]